MGDQGGVFIILHITAQPGDVILIFIASSMDRLYGGSVGGRGNACVSKSQVDNKVLLLCHKQV